MMALNIVPISFQLIFTKSHGVCPTRSGVTNDCSKCTCGECRADTQTTEERISSLETQMQQVSIFENLYIYRPFKVEKRS